MFTPKKLLLAAATFMAVETAFISPVQALTFRFRFSSPLSDIPYVTEITGDSGSLTIDGWNGNFNPSDSYSWSGLPLRGSLEFSTMSSFSTPYHGDLIGLQSGHKFVSWWWWYQGQYTRPLTWNMQIFCNSSNLMNCNNSSGTFAVRFGLSPSNPIYSADIIVDNFSLSQPTRFPPITNSVPEPSLISALWLLGSSLLLGKKRKMVIPN